MADKNLISFWTYIQKYVITIPIIQRDYAQGRKGKEYLRQNFLTSIKRALDNSEQPLVLDFVYGGLKDSDKTVLPLDGQQRLTTLWLLHWYIAYKAGVLANVSETLKRFHYETRISSDEFIKHLCMLDYLEDDGKNNLKKHIKSQRWYRTIWDSDPTIKAMLTMIQGSDVKDRNGSDIIDGLIELFEGCTKNEFEKYWTVLTEAKPIVFYEYALGKEDLPETDSLYVKMNARGKPLSDFENFKADLFNYLKTKANCSEEELSTIGAWFDNAGADLFWKHSNKQINGFVIDEVFFAFLQRYFLKKLIDETSSESIETVINRKAFKLLFDRSNDKQQETSYKDFSSFEDLGDRILSKETFAVLQKVSASLKEIEGINTLSKSNWSSADPNIIPQYIDQLKPSVVSGITVKGRLVFSSVIDYLEHNPGLFNKSSFNDWMRFVWNIIEGTDTSSAESLIQVSRFLHRLANHAASIISHLADSDIKRDDRDSELNRQFTEEIIKAKRIKFLRDDNDEESEKVLYAAEKSNFYKGSIRFLYTTEDGNVDWNDFNTKFKNSLIVFDPKGVAPDYRQDSLLLCFFISVQTKWMQIKDLVFSNNADEWRTILRRERYKSSIHNILMSPDIIKAVDSSYVPRLEQAYLEQGYEDLNRQVQRDLCNYELMNNIVGAMDNCGRLHWRYDHYCVYPPNAKADWKKYIIATPRNQIMSQLISSNTVTLEPNRSIGNSGFLWGWDITFDYKGKTYCWDAWGNLKYYSEKRPQVKINALDVESFLKLLNS